VFESMSPRACLFLVVVRGQSNLLLVSDLLLRIRRTMPKDIVSKFCFFMSKCGQQVDIKGTIRDSYLFEVD